jgi:hypothetical protein
MPVAFEAMSWSHATYIRLIASVAPLFSHVRLSMTTSDLQKQLQGILPKLIRAQLTAAGIVICQHKIVQQLLPLVAAYKPMTERK